MVYLGMTNWGDYAITAVDMSSNGDRISRVRVYEVGEDALLNGQEMIRSRAVDLVKENDVTTALKNDNGKWVVGEDVHVIVVDGTEYIRTDRNNTPADNLGNLPEL
jgi:hypothetical protein